MSNPPSAIQLLRVVHPFDAFELYIQGPTQSRAPPCSQAGKSSPCRCRLLSAAHAVGSAAHRFTGAHWCPESSENIKQSLL